MSKKKNPYEKIISILAKTAEQVEKASEQVSKVLDEAEETGEMAPALMAFQGINEGYKLVNDARKAIYHQKDRWDKGVIPGLFEKKEVDKVRVPELERSFYPLTKYTASLKDKEAAYEWLRGNGFSELITETVNAGTLSSAMVGFEQETGQSPPPELIVLNSYETIGSSKYKPKKGKK